MALSSALLTSTCVTKSAYFCVGTESIFVACSMRALMPCAVSPLLPLSPLSTSGVLLTVLP